MARNPNTFSLGGPGGVIYLTPAEARRLVSAAMQQLKATQAARGLTETELRICDKIEASRRHNPQIGI